MSHGRIRELFDRGNFKTMAFLVGMYGIWNLWAGTGGFFFPYILHTVGNAEQARSPTGCRPPASSSARWRSTSSSCATPTG